MNSYKICDWKYCGPTGSRNSTRICKLCGKRQYRTYDLDVCKHVWKDE